MEKEQTMIHEAWKPRIYRKLLDLGDGRTALFKLTVYPAYGIKIKHSHEGRIRTCRRKRRLNPRLSIIYCTRYGTAKNTGKPRIYRKRFPFDLSDPDGDLIYDQLSQCAHQCNIHGTLHGKFLDTYDALRHHAII